MATPNYGYEKRQKELAKKKKKEDKLKEKQERKSHGGLSPVVREDDAARPDAPDAHPHTEADA